ncbi:uncharacterized protein [Ambystoma mexicanum]|uniref:uncharacterized protein n=1 Tax=Ambystoma mexicanum TaxID=8296 RepID=UPI0037E70650
MSFRGAYDMPLLDYEDTECIWESADSCAIVGHLLLVYIVLIIAGTFVYRTYLMITHKCWPAPAECPEPEPTISPDSSSCDLHKKPGSWESFLNLFRTRNKNVHLRMTRSTEAMPSGTLSGLQKRHRRRLCPRSFHQRVRCIDTTDNDGAISDSTSWGESEAEPELGLPTGYNRTCAVKPNRSSYVLPRCKSKPSREYKAKCTRAWLAQNCALGGRSSTEDHVGKGSCLDNTRRPKGQTQRVL